MTTVAEESGIKHRETASRVTARLAAYGVIIAPRPSKGGKPTVYFFNYPLANCDSRITVATPRTVIPQSQWSPSDRDSRQAKTRATAILQSRSKYQNRDSPVTRRGCDDDDGREKSSSHNAAASSESHSPNGDRLDDFKKIVLAKCKDDSDGTVATTLDIIIERARQSGVTVSSPKYLEAALDRFNFHEGQDREDLMQRRRRPCL